MHIKDPAKPLPFGQVISCSVEMAVVLCNFMMSIIVSRLKLKQEKCVVEAACFLSLSQKRVFGRRFMF